MVKGYRANGAAQYLHKQYRTDSTRGSIPRLPGIKPSLSQSQQASTTGQVVLDWNRVPLWVQSRDVVAVGGLWAQPSMPANVKEVSYPFSLPCCFNSHAIFKHMPAKIRNMCVMYKSKMPWGHRWRGLEEVSAGRAKCKPPQAWSRSFVAQWRLIHKPHWDHLQDTLQDCRENEQNWFSFQAVPHHSQSWRLGRKSWGFLYSIINGSASHQKLQWTDTPRRRVYFIGCTRTLDQDRHLKPCYSMGWYSQECQHRGINLWDHISCNIIERQTDAWNKDNYNNISDE